MFLEPLQNDEIKESLNQTSNKNTFEIFDTKPSTSANDDPSDPPKKKKKDNGDITTVSFLIIHLFANSFKKNLLCTLINILWCRKHWRILKSRKTHTKLLRKTNLKLWIQNHQQTQIKMKVDQIKNTIMVSSINEFCL